MSLAAVIGALHAASIQPTAREIAEAIWLAQYVAPPSVAATELGQRLADENDGRDGKPAPGSASSSDDQVPLGASTSRAAGSTVRGHPVGVPAIPGLHHRQDIQRALRPLRRYGPSRRRRVIDEDATVAFIANTGIWTPVTRPEPERWFDAVLVVDSSSSMDLWRPLIADLRSVLAGTGAFRDVRPWRLRPQGQPMIFPAGPMAGPRSPRELIDGAGRRLFFVVTDGAAEGWHDRSATAVLAEWGNTGPVVVLQMLPEKMWPRTGLATVPVLLSAHTLGPRNTQLRVDYRRRRRTPGIPIPLLGVEPTALHSWARLVAGSASAVPLAVTPAGGDHPIPASSITQNESGAAMDRFRGSASPQAYQLAVCLSAVTLTLPIMRLVQHAAMPASNPSALAEVILGGLISRTGDNTYEFQPGVREELLGELRRSELITVLSAASDYIAQHAGRASHTFPAIAQRADGPVAANAEIFSWVPRAVAVRLGLPTATPGSEQEQGPGRAAPSTEDQGKEQSGAGPVSLNRDLYAARGNAPAPAPRERAPGLSGSRGSVNNAPPVFISYARAGAASDQAVGRFFNELRGNLQELIALPVGTDMAFLDSESLPPAARWQNELTDALGTCQVLVALLSVPYLESEWCGKEWHAFTLREREPLPGADKLRQQASIVPVRWAPIPFTLPAAVNDVQIFTPPGTKRQPDLPRQYAEAGIFGLLRGGQEDAFHEVVWDLSKRIQQIYYSQRLRPRLFVPDELRNALASGAP
ncbi:MAG: toll/interleukin-1 receptor domain-containing protein [Trebonia sp.]|jgi:hypothetical protein